MRFKQLNFVNTTVPKGIKAFVKYGKYDLSIIKNEMSYGNDKELYEIAVYKGKDQVELPGITENGDTVKGFLSEKEVEGIMLKLHAVTGNDGVNNEWS